jgi:hypothetical protein
MSYQRYWEMRLRELESEKRKIQKEIRENQGNLSYLEKLKYRKEMIDQAYKERKKEVDTANRNARYR